jgi:Xaa-Pro dipeptidase
MANDFGNLYRAHVVELERGYARALEASGYDAVVIHSGTPKKRTEVDDQYWSLRPLPEFQHWLPLVWPDCALVIRTSQRPRLVWPRPANFWEQPPPVEEQFWQAAFDVITTEEVADVRAHLHPLGRAAFISDEPRRADSWGLGDVNPPGLVKALERLRVHKTAYEVACLAEANRIAARGHQAVAAAFAEGDRSELDLHLLFLGATSQDDPETPYKNIVALGENAATLHHVSYRKHARTRPAESLLLDAGATFNGYCSDITRTYVKGAGATASAFGQLVSATEHMQQRLCAAVELGKPYEQLHEEAHRQVATILAEVGVARMSADEIVSAGVSRAFFPHGLGHSLGLQCHDVGCAEVKPKVENPFLRNTSVIAENQVFTIEPGIYFIDMLLAPLRYGKDAGRMDWALVDALSSLGGVRIEDDLQVRAAGQTPRNLTREYLP